MEKRPFFPGGYSRIGEIPHGRLRPDWGLTPSLPQALILPRLGYRLIFIYSYRESPGNPREFPKIKEKLCIMQGTIPRILIMQLKQVLVFDITLNVL